MLFCSIPNACHWGKSTGVDHGGLGLNQETAILTWDGRGRILSSRKKKLTGKFSVFSILDTSSLIPGVKGRRWGQEAYSTCELVPSRLTFQRGCHQKWRPGVFQIFSAQVK